MSQSTNKRAVTSRSSSPEAQKRMRVDSSHNEEERQAGETLISMHTTEDPVNDLVRSSSLLSLQDKEDGDSMKRLV